MKKIWKYEISTDKMRFSIPVPRGAMFLTAQIQHGKPVMWATVPNEGSLEQRTFVLFETGQPILEYEGVLRFVATLQIDGGKYILHLFEEEQ